MQIQEMRKFPKAALELIQKYKLKDEQDIHNIRAKWACGKHMKYSRIYKHPTCYKLFYVEMRVLLELADFEEVGNAPVEPLKLFKDIPERDFRVAKVLDHWSKGEYIDPPEVYVHFSKLVFSDGCHRTVAAFHIGEDVIPIYIHVSNVNSVLKRISRKDCIHC